MVPDTSKKECLAMLELAKNITNLISDSMLGLTLSNESVCDVNIQRALFQVGSLSPLFFSLYMIPLTLILSKVEVSYEMCDKEFKINNLLFMVDF